MCDPDAAWYHHMVHIIGFIRLTAVQQTLGAISLILPAETVCNCIKPFRAYSLIFEIPACCTSAFVGLQFLNTSRYSYSAFAAMQRNSSPTKFEMNQSFLYEVTPSLIRLSIIFFFPQHVLIKFKYFCNKIFLSKKWFHKRDFNEREEHGWVFDSSCLGESYLWRDW